MPATYAYALYDLFTLTCGKLEMHHTRQMPEMQ